MLAPPLGGLSSVPISSLGGIGNPLDDIVEIE